MSFLRGLCVVLVAAALFAIAVGLQAAFVWVGFVAFAPAVGMTWLGLLAPVGLATFLSAALSAIGKAVQAAHS